MQEDEEKVCVDGGGGEEEEKKGRECGVSEGKAEDEEDGERV